MACQPCWCIIYVRYTNMAASSHVSENCQLKSLYFFYKKYPQVAEVVLSFPSQRMCWVNNVLHFCNLSMNLIEVVSLFNWELFKMLLKGTLTWFFTWQFICVNGNQSRNDCMWLATEKYCCENWKLKSLRINCLSLLSFSELRNG